MELLRTAYHAFIANVATGYIDRREVLAALDGQVPRNPHEADDDVVGSDPTGKFLNFERVEGDIWIDYVADIGDSWEATYATATMLAQRTLTVRGLTAALPAADLVVLGGDLVYPVPSRAAYRTRTRSAFLAALPPPPPPSPVQRSIAIETSTRMRQRHLLAIPGNHDWYDGLTSFLREFCGGGMYGGWKLSQGRSYFAAKLPNGWWLWGIDIALDSRIDLPQQRYFLNLLTEQFAAATDSAALQIPIILCTAKPVWLGNPKHSTDAYNNLAYFADLIRTHSCKIRVMLSGDIHHYSRFESDEGEQMIVAGGGGAYLNGTHQLPASVPEVTDPRPIEHGQRIVPLTADASEMAPEKRFRASEFPYPSRVLSRRLALGALLLAARPANWPFVLLVGSVYALLAKSIHPSFPREYTPLLGQDSAVQQFISLIKGIVMRAPVLTPTGVLLVIGFCSAITVSLNRGSRMGRASWGALHGAAHVMTMLWLTALVAQPRLHDMVRGIFRRSGVLSELWVGWLTTLCVILMFILIGGVIGATLVGAFFVISDRTFGWHMNEAFVVQSLIDYRNFLRIKLAADGSLTIYPIGLQQVPRRWRARAAAVSAAKHAPLYEPGDATIDPHLIEAPIVVRRTAAEVEAIR